MRVLVSGDRHYNNYAMMYTILAGMYSFVDGSDVDLTIIEGEAPGADIMSRKIGEELGAEVERYPAEWNTHDYEGTSGIKCTHWTRNGYCPAAGVRRNAQMLDEGKPDVVLCFHDDFENSRGTKDMATRAKEAGVPTYLIQRL